MQENKKQTDGQSDSSSIGSLLDDTDREVCSLTDRAFKSLCVAELETSYMESAPSVPNNNPHQLSSTFFQGAWNYTIKENTLSHKQLPKAEKQSTFQQFPNDSQENKKASTNIRKNLGLSVPGLCNYKHTSKVSSLIKTFDKAENEASLALTKHPNKNSLKKCPVIFGHNITFLGSKTILNIQKELSEFSDTSQEVANENGTHEVHKRHSKMDLICQGPYSFYFSQADACKSKISCVSKMTVKSRTEKAKEPARKGRFLHSENSAFESWNAHHKKLSKIGGSTEIIPKEGNPAYFEESCISKHNVTDITVPGILEQDFSDALSEKSEVSLSSVAVPKISLPKGEDTVSQILLPQGSTPSPPVCKIPISLSLPSLPSKDPSLLPLAPQTEVLTVPLSKVPISLSQTSVPPVTASDGTDKQMLVPRVILLPKKASSPELENVCPPWRKQKLAFGEMEVVQDIANQMFKRKDSPYRKVPDFTLLTEAAGFDSPIAVSVPSSSSFNISKLLTPVILQEKDEAERQLLLVTPPISDNGAANETTLCCPQNNYKSKAPSLLFNLKDIRKRVKSTYSPSRLLRATENKKWTKEQDNKKASVIAVSAPQEDSKKLVDNSDNDHHISKQTDNTHENSTTTNLNGNYLIPTAPRSKADSLIYTNRNNLRQHTSLDIENFNMVSGTALHPAENGLRQYSPISNCFLGEVTTEQDVYLKNHYLQDSKNEKTVICHSSDVGPQASPHLIITAEENMINNQSQTCALPGNEQKGKRSTSSSEQSFISITDQPSNEMNCSLMQLFQKACLQESQRKKFDMSVEEKPNNKEKEELGRKEKLYDSLLSDYNCYMDRKCERKKELSENGNAVQEVVVKEKKEDRWKTIDSASEGKSEEPLTLTSLNSCKPNLFMIKDNTFKSSPVIKAVKLPLLRSFSCEDATAGSHSETEKQNYGPMQAIMSTEEVDLSFSRMRSQQKVEDAGTDRNTNESSVISLKVDYQLEESSNPTAKYTLTEGLGSIISLVEYDGGGGGDRGNSISVLSGKDLKISEKLVKEKVRAGELKLNPDSQPNLAFYGELTQDKQKSPTREKANYSKNHLISKHRGSFCVKKIISQETRSPVVSDNPTSSPALSDTIEDISATTVSLSNSTLPSTRSDSVVSSAFTSPLTTTMAVFNVSQAEKITNASVLNKAIESKDNPIMEIFNPIQNYISEDANHSPVTNEKTQLMAHMAKTAAKPPAVPPKTEKALRKAKKLANRRKKTETQQKRLQEKPTLHSEDTAQLSFVQSPLSPACPSSPLTPSDSNLVGLCTTPLNPTPSLPTTKRKLLQDPDSGEYFIIDLPIQLKTFYDPESGRYVQLSISSSERNLSQTPTSEIPSSPYILSPNTLPLRVSSVPVLASPSQLSETASSLQGTLLNSTLKWQLAGQCPGGQPCDAHGQEGDESQCNFEKDGHHSANADIISVGAIEDFVVEGIL
ncbi:LOW QUALITY PROTEIN: cardiac-enriched FHL2-interacting protein [Sceloporus undulatus]|uniref:LOW QUALITY PROTEIN: cardiac-enriched FHL2-interacting protein n=1 Tax=Sceloporus undulatus TaxID=8520 RepID=UPI001C4CB697|nr:LOW QUALITY PROTEIN: cardiac-enriched FHL2-interacting protein [Sceloporus undulatus]